MSKLVGFMRPQYRVLEELDFVRMNLPNDAKDSKLDKIPESARSPVQGYIDNLDEIISNGGGLVFLGKPGVGKSMAAGVLAKAAQSQGYSVLWTSIDDLREMLRNKIAFDPQTSFFERCRDVDILVLDNVHEDSVSSPFLTKSEFEGLINYRVSWKRPILFTTRLAKNEFMGQMAGAYSALTGSVLYVQVEGPNQRVSKEDKLRGLVRPKGSILSDSELSIAISRVSAAFGLSALAESEKELITKGIHGWGESEFIAKIRKHGAKDCQDLKSKIQKEVKTIRSEETRLETLWLEVAGALDEAISAPFKDRFLVVLRTTSPSDIRKVMVSFPVMSPPSERLRLTLAKFEAETYRPF